MFSALNFRVGFFLAIRQIRRASLWTTGLIVSVMLLTFLNLVVVTGLLVGIVDGISNLYRAQETGDVMVSTLKTKNYIEHSGDVLSFLHTLPQIQDMTARYVAGGSVEANYRTRTDLNDKANETGTNVVGIDPEAEAAFSKLPTFLREGSYFQPGDYDVILIGSQLIDRYSFGGDVPGLTALHNVYPGTRVRLTVGGVTREVTVKGIIGTTANSPLATEVFMPSD